MSGERLIINHQGETVQAIVVASPKYRGHVVTLQAGLREIWRSSGTAGLYVAELALAHTDVVGLICKLADAIGAGVVITPGAVERARKLGRGTAYDGLAARVEKIVPGRPARQTSDG